MKRAVIMLAILAGTPALARDSLGIFGGWGAFRDATPYRCYAIAQPEDERGSPQAGYATLSWWPSRNIRGQFHVRFAAALRDGTSVFLSAGGRRWRLTASENEAWSPSARHDAYIIAKLRAASAMHVTGIDRKHGNFSDFYSLQGAASAFDAAALGCAKTG